MNSDVSSQTRRRLRRERDRLESEAEQTSEINLVPYLDIVTNILLFLLVTITSMITLGNIEVVFPKKTLGGASASMAQKAVPDQPPLNLTVTVTGKGFTIAGSPTTIGILYQNNEPNKLPTIPKTKNNTYDFDQLRKMIADLKNKYPQEDQAILTANPDIPYETIIAVMDAMRLGPSKKVLFPKVLFSTGLQ